MSALTVVNFNTIQFDFERRYSISSNNISW